MAAPMNITNIGCAGDTARRIRELLPRLEAFAAKLEAISTETIAVSRREVWEDHQRIEQAWLSVFGDFTGTQTLHPDDPIEDYGAPWPIPGNDRCEPASIPGAHERPLIPTKDPS